MITLSEDTLEEYELFINNPYKTNNKLIEQFILPYPHFVVEEKKNYPAIIHNFWFQNLKTNKIYDFNIVYYKNQDKEKCFYIIVGDKLIKNESKSSDLRFNSMMNHFYVKNNQTTILEIMKDKLLKISKQIQMKTGLSYETFTPKNKKITEEETLNRVFKDYITEEKFPLYIKKLNILYEKLFIKKSNKIEIENELFIYNEYFSLNKIKDEIYKEEIKKSKSQLDRMLDRNIFKNRQLFVFGRHGVGKTYGIRKYVEQNGYELVSIQANNSIDDIYLKGHLMKDYTGNFKWKYGKLSLAFKRAAQGKKIIVFIDEFLRLPETTFNNLITAMDPYDGYYIYDTERPIQSKNVLDEDCMETEELKVPIENIWFVCSSNVGADYNVEELETALKDRFIFYHLQMEEKEIIKIIKYLLNMKKYKKENNKIITFFKKMNHLYQLNKINNEINLRHMSDIILMADNEDDLKDRIKDKILLWVDNDLRGIPKQEELKIINDLINQIWEI